MGGAVGSRVWRLGLTVGVRGAVGCPPRWWRAVGGPGWAWRARGGGFLLLPGGVLSAAAGCVLAVAARVEAAWGVWELLPVISSCRLSCGARGRVCSSCV